MQTKTSQMTQKTNVRQIAFEEANHYAIAVLWYIEIKNWNGGGAPRMHASGKCVLGLLLILFFAGCEYRVTAGQLKNVGLLLPTTIDEKVWAQKGYEGVLTIGAKQNVDVFVKEKMTTFQEVREAVRDFEDHGVNLVFGHGNIYGDIMMKIKDEFPTMHFVAVNGKVHGERITGLHFEGKAMGFFAGMVAAYMSENRAVGVIAAYPWQPEVDGFIEGAIYVNRNIEIHYDFVQSWNDEKKALAILQEMIADGVDVVYPAGDGFHIPVVQALKNKGLYAIGYVSDQSYLGERTVLTSTVQRVGRLYEMVAEKFNRGELKSGNLY